MRSSSLPKFQDIRTHGRHIEGDFEGNEQFGRLGTHGASHRQLHESRRTASQESQEITLGNHATRVSMVEDMLMSLNTLPDVQGPHPPQQRLPPSVVAETSTTPTFLQRALTGHRRAKSSVATTTTSTTADARDPHAQQDTSHTRNPTITQASYLRKDSAATMSSEAKRDMTPRAVLHKTRPSVTNASPKQTGEMLRRESATSMGRQESDSRNQSPARVGETDARDGNRRRSRSFNISSSVLNRSRPVPSEYHNFKNDSSYTFGARPNLRKSSSNPNHHQSRMHEEFPPDLPTDRSFPPTSYLSQYDLERPSSGTPSSTKAGLPDREISSNLLGSSYGSGEMSKNMADTKPQAKTKDRPGFFKRIFGPSKTNLQAESGPPQLPPLQVDTKRTAKTETEQDNSVVSPLTPNAPALSSPVDAEASQQKVPAQALRQKSSFFRRRRKTVNDKGSGAVSREESPSARNSSRPSTSSLRQAMDPFIVHDPMPDDLDLEQLESLRRLNQQQDAYEFLRSSPQTATKSAKPRAPAANEATGTNISRLEHRRPSTSVPDPKAREIPRLRTHEDDFVDSSFSASSTRPASSPTAPPASDADQATPGLATPTKLGQTPLQPKKAPPPPPLDVSAGKRDTRSRLQSSANQSRSNSEKGSTRVPHSDSEPLPLGPPKRPANPRAVASDNSVGTTEDYISAKSIPVVQLDDEEDDNVSPLPTAVEVNGFTPWTPKDFERAQRLWESQADPSRRTQGIGDLAEAGDAGNRLRVAFMSFFDFTGLNILLALRDLCARVSLKGETQQMDRVVAAFAERWCECNPYHGFKSEDVVHTVCYSLLLLNTDLHIVESNEKMTQRQFVKNTVPTLRRIAEAEAFDPNSTLRPGRSQARPPVPWTESRSSSPVESPEPGATFDKDPAGLLSPLQSASIRRPISGVPSVAMASPSPYDNHPIDPSELLVNAPHEGSMKRWESSVETVLKEFYTSVRQLRLPLHGASDLLQEQPSSNSLSVVSSIMRRTGSVISKTPSEQSRGRVPEFRSTGSRWSSKNRSKPRPYPSSTLGSSRTGSRTSLDDNSPWSPSASSTWSKSYGQTQTTMSTDSLASRFASGFDPGYQQSIGFANALSHAIIREENAGEEASLSGETPLLEDQTLELAGAPWAKEGIVQHKHHLETVDKKAKARNWSECFAVVEKGMFRLFSFNKPKSSLRSPKTPKGAVVGGGNWMDNANAVGTFMLRQTIANALPPPGYSKARPYVFALSLPTGAVHLFQVGTPEIAREFVSTANYWSARLSKEPLMGGVSNIEYGWGDSVINTALVAPEGASRTLPSGPPSSYHLPRTSSSISAQGGSGGRSRHSPSPSLSMTPSNSSRPSLHESLRSSLDAASRPIRTRLPADRITLSEWQPPQQSIMASTLSEQAQLEALVRYVHGVEEDLARHNELRNAMALAFTPRSANAQRALGNWERKSSHLLHEIVKFRTYVDSLRFAALEAKRVKEQPTETSAAAGTSSPAKNKENMRGRIRKVESTDSVVGLSEEEELSEETREALRTARLKHGQGNSGLGV